MCMCSSGVHVCSSVYCSRGVCCTGAVVCVGDVVSLWWGRLTISLLHSGFGEPLHKLSLQKGSQFTHFKVV
jgi:hypothetical protein